jgi:hypothetical protein
MGEPTPCECYFYLDLDSGTVYQRLGPTYDTWTEQGTIPGDGTMPPPPGGWYPGDFLFPPKVAGVVVTPTYKSQQDGTPIPALKVVWDPVLPTDIIGYEVQWDEWVNETPATWATPHVLKVGADVTDVTFTDHIIGNTPYDVRVRAYDLEGYKGAWSDTATAMALMDTVPPAVPSNLDSASGYGLMAVDWDANQEQDFSFYEVALWKTSDEAGTITMFRSPASRFVIGNLENEVEYGVRVRAVDRSGNISAWSVDVTATPTKVPQADMVFESITVNDFIDTGELSANAITSGTLTLGGAEYGPGPYLVVLDDTLPIPVQMLRIDHMGIVSVDPNDPARAMRWQGGRLEFTETFTDTVPIWTTALSGEGIVADTILLGSQPGGHNMVKNSGFELFPLAIEQEAKWDTQGEWAGHIGAINMDTTTAVLGMDDYT